MRRSSLVPAMVLAVAAACSGEATSSQPPAQATSAPAEPTAPAPTRPATPVVPTPARPAISEATAMAAYDAKDYATCAEQFAQLAKTVRPIKRAEMIYSVACCHAMAKDADRTFAALDDAIAAGWLDADHTEKDTDLVGLHGDRRWAGLLGRIRARAAEIAKALTKPALRRELLAMVEKDQAARMAVVNANKSGGSGDWSTVEPIDKVNTARLHEILVTDGWPGKSMVGADGAHAAWLLVQHADRDMPLQKDVLGRMKRMVDTDEVSEVDYAYLEDRVAVAEHRKQRYGTQFDGNREPRPIEDEANVDARRTALGMPTMAQYRKSMLDMYGPPKK